MRALIIDDSRTMRTILAGMLRQLGFETAEAGNGLEALGRLRAGGLPDVALVDWNMPVMGGLEFIQAVRDDPALCDLRLMMVTTETEMHQVANALQAGADEYVMKPFTREAIKDKLDLLGMTGQC
jgi:two-component system chemotaxis response regulator CheY